MSPGPLRRPRTRASAVAVANMLGTSTGMAIPKSHARRFSHSLPPSTSPIPKSPTKNNKMMDVLPASTSATAANNTTTGGGGDSAADFLNLDHLTHAPNSAFSPTLTHHHSPASAASPLVLLPSPTLSSHSPRSLPAADASGLSTGPTHATTTLTTTTTIRQSPSHRHRHLHPSSSSSSSASSPASNPIAVSASPGLSFASPLLTGLNVGGVNSLSSSVAGGGVVGGHSTSTSTQFGAASPSKTTFPMLPPPAPSPRRDFSSSSTMSSSSASSSIMSPRTTIGAPSPLSSGPTGGIALSSASSTPTLSAASPALSLASQIQMGSTSHSNPGSNAPTPTAASSAGTTPQQQHQNITFLEPLTSTSLASLSSSTPIFPGGLRRQSHLTLGGRRSSRSQAARRVVSHAAKKPDGHIPRPPNCFLLYRSWVRAQSKLNSAKDGDAGKKNEQKVSVIVGTLWEDLPEEKKEIFRAEARRLKEEHMKRYPGYKYTPRARKAATPNNAASTKGKGKGKAVAADDDEDGGNTPEDDYEDIDDDSATTVAATTPVNATAAVHPKTRAGVSTRSASTRVVPTAPPSLSTRPTSSRGGSENVKTTNTSSSSTTASKPSATSTPQLGTVSMPPSSNTSLASISTVATTPAPASEASSSTAISSKSKRSTRKMAPEDVESSIRHANAMIPQQRALEDELLGPLAAAAKVEKAQAIARAHAAAQSKGMFPTLGQGLGLGMGMFSAKPGANQQTAPNHQGPEILAPTPQLASDLYVPPTSTAPYPSHQQQQYPSGSQQGPSQSQGGAPKEFNFVPYRRSSSAPPAPEGALDGVVPGAGMGMGMGMGVGMGAGAITAQYIGGTAYGHGMPMGVAPSSGKVLGKRTAPFAGGPSTSPRKGQHHATNSMGGSMSPYARPAIPRKAGTHPTPAGRLIMPFEMPTVPALNGSGPSSRAGTPGQYHPHQPPHSAFPHVNQHNPWGFGGPASAGGHPLEHSQYPQHQQGQAAEEDEDAQEVIRHLEEMRKMRGEQPPLFDPGYSFPTGGDPMQASAGHPDGGIPTKRARFEGPGITTSAGKPGSNYSETPLHTPVDGMHSLHLQNAGAEQAMYGGGFDHQSQQPHGDYWHHNPAYAQQPGPSSDPDADFNAQQMELRRTFGGAQPQSQLPQQQQQQQQSQHHFNAGEYQQQHYDQLYEPPHSAPSRQGAIEFPSNYSMAVPAQNQHQHQPPPMSSRIAPRQIANRSGASGSNTDTSSTGTGPTHTPPSNLATGLNPRAPSLLKDIDIGQVMNGIDGATNGMEMDPQQQHQYADVDMFSNWSGMVPAGIQGIPPHGGNPEAGAQQTSAFDEHVKFDLGDLHGPSSTSHTTNTNVHDTSQQNMIDVDPLGHLGLPPLSSLGDVDSYSNILPRPSMFGFGSSAFGAMTGSGSLSGAGTSVDDTATHSQAPTGNWATGFGSFGNPASAGPGMYSFGDASYGGNGASVLGPTGRRLSQRNNSGWLRRSSLAGDLAGVGLGEF